MEIYTQEKAAHTCASAIKTVRCFVNWAKTSFLSKALLTFCSLISLVYVGFYKFSTKLNPLDAVQCKPSAQVLYSLYHSCHNSKRGGVKTSLKDTSNSLQKFCFLFYIHFITTAPSVSGSSFLK